MASRTPKRNASGRFERCVAKVSKRPGVASPRGVCATAGRKKYGAKKFAAMGRAGKGRRPPTRKNLWPFDAFSTSTTYHVKRKRGAATSLAKTYKGHRIERRDDGYLVPSIDRFSVFDDLRQAKRFIDFQTKNNASRKKRGAKAARRATGKKKRVNAGRKPAKRKNGLETAENIYQKFHGRKRDVVLDILEPMHVHKHLSGIGDLVGMQVLQPNGLAKVTLKFDDGTVLAQNEKRNQLFIRGGDQSVDLKDFGITGPHHELENLGEVIWISYFTRKDHLAPEDGGEAIYKHRFGRKKPTLIYDTVNKKMELAGGGYDIPDEGIDR